MISVLIGLLIIDSVGRRVLLLFSLFGSFIGLTTLAVYFHCKHSNLNLSSYRFVPLCCLIWTVLCYGVGLQQVPYVMQGELFTTGVKASAVCCGLIVFCAFSLSCSKYFQYMDDHFGAHFAFYTFAGFNVSTFFLVLFFIPETKNISLEDVQVLIKQKKIHFENVNMESSQR
ncbi:hypothetical protein HHI36_019406 [Cryptolaemus montrouzieri]|uniref:Major facilitator superfamily (MFS) profile domain-containing protein n=1 Tax=Cryptolaemus montrouzieri TaxID=559131 RepID=A0ABD2P3M1_9CUCU